MRDRKSQSLGFATNRQSGPESISMSRRTGHVRWHRNLHIYGMLEETLLVMRAKKQVKLQDHTRATDSNVSRKE